MKKEYLKCILLVLFIIGILGFLWARYISTSGLIIKEYAVKDSKLPESFDGFKIIQFSDLHYGTTVDIAKLKKVIKKINDQKADIILFTGDLIDSTVKVDDKELKLVINELNKLNPKIETLAVIGNHDYETNYWNKIIPNLNWKVLDNTYEFIYNNSSTPIILTGFDDLLEGKPDYNNAFSFSNEYSDDIYTIAVMHEPDQIEEIKKYKFDLAVAAHSHLGQVRLPLIGAIWTPAGSKKYYDEHYIVNDKDLYINGGIGTSFLKLRFFNKPSINLYRFYTK